MLLSLVSVGVFLLFLSAVNPNEPSSEKKEGTKIANVDVKIPKELYFAGEKVPLQYFDVRESLEREMISMQYFHSQSIYLLKRVNRYFVVIEPLLKKYGIPDDFKYLAVAESVLDDRAMSPVKAMGVWQLMKGTAQDYGLEVNSNVDERRNLDLATKAACQYFLESYERYHSWTLVAASYNMGRKALDFTIDYSKQQNYYDMYFNPETARYVYRILAFKLLLESPEDYGFSISPKNKYYVFKCDTISVDYPIEHLTDFAEEHGMTYKTLKLFNPWFMENHLNNASQKEYKILVPREKHFREKY